MPAIKKAPELLELKGAYDKNPQRRPQNLMQPTDGIGEYPVDKPLDDAGIWNELVEILPNGVLMNTDRYWLELTCDLMVKFRVGTINSSERTHLLTCLSHLGMSPADRARINVGDANKKKSAFEGL
jgi:hypothetical protein